MIEPDRWLAFLAASLLIGILPGPGVANIVGYALSSGKRTALAAVTGAVGGNVVAMSASLAGMGFLVRASPHAFRLVEFAGALYLIALGFIGLLRAGARGGPGELARPAISPGAAFAGSIAVSASSPKSIVFFLAFVPQFVCPTAAYAAQCFVLVLTFASVVAATDIAYAFLALRAARLLRSPSTNRWARRAGAAVFLLTGFATLVIG